MEDDDDSKVRWTEYLGNFTWTIDIEGTLEWIPKEAWEQGKPQ